MAGNKTNTPDDWLATAFQTAFFILDNRDLALRVTGIAAEKLEVAAAAQEKRLYYRPKVDTGSKSSRSKAVFNEAHLFQRLVLTETEPFEKELEGTYCDVPEHQARMAIHYVKHLVKATLKRNSFYVTLAFCRLLYNYTTPETMAIFEKLAPDEAEAKDDPYFRSRKGKLMGEIQERFGERIEVVQGPHGERKFKTLGDSAPFADVVVNALRIFAPWEIPGTETENARLLETPGDASEIERIRTIVHPEESHRFICKVGFAPPIERLEIPKFRLPPMPSSNSQRHGPSLPTLSDADRQALKENLRVRAEQRRDAKAEMLTIRVDGVEFARFNPLSSPGVNFEVEDDAEIIDVRLESGGLPLATMFLERDRSGERFLPGQTSITLEGGQKISFDCIPKEDGAEFNPKATIHVGYRETAPARAVGFSFRRAGKAFFSPVAGESKMRPAIALTGLATLLVGVTSGALWLLDYFNPTPSVADRSENIIVKNEPSKNGPEPFDSKDPRSNSSNILPNSNGFIRELGDERPRDSTNRSENPVPKSSPRESRTPRNGRAQHSRRPAYSTSMITRDMNSGSVVAELKEVKTVYLKVEGSDSAFNAFFLSNLRAHFQGKTQIAISEDQNAADTHLQVMIDPPKSDPSTELIKRRITGTVRLVNADLKTIWPGPKGGRFSGTADEVSRQLANDLANSIEKARAKS
jgi:hypothetical protein